MCPPKALTASIRRESSSRDATVSDMTPTSYIPISPPETDILRPAPRSVWKTLCPIQKFVKLKRICSYLSWLTAAGSRRALRAAFEAEASGRVGDRGEAGLGALCRQPDGEARDVASALGIGQLLRVEADDICAGLGANLA